MEALPLFTPLDLRAQGALLGVVRLTRSRASLPMTNVRERAVAHRFETLLKVR